MVTFPASQRCASNCEWQTDRRNWYLQFQYEEPHIQRLGCYVLTHSAAENPYEININGSFSRQPDFPVSAKVAFKGNLVVKAYAGDKEFSGEYNLVYVDKDIAIDQFCYLGQEMSQIFTTEKKPSAELLERIWKIVDEHPEVEKSLFKEVIC
ncbi:uncharacterized protein LOC124623178 [Schistocerca americana]|uniref:uncharacterized protein LOC124623178 n=1 Tax=Schistocerca americana TaxID=7009 RepID=UPI001F4F35D2|nr:uncharacterized protein LOC124623178 [Schistocerca americana]